MGRRTLDLPDAADIADTFLRVEKFVPSSPLLASPFAGKDCWLKLESLQRTGSFKIRGATAALTKIPQGENIVTCSAGNHGLAVAVVAKELGIKATIVVSQKASPKKIELLRKETEDLIVHGIDYDEAEDFARELAESRNVRYLSPYNDPDVILGQASVGVELLSSFSGPITVVCPIGGGGLAAGIGMALSFRPGSRLIGVEAANSAPMKLALDRGETVPIDIFPTIAEGLAGNLERGSITVGLLSKYSESTLAVTESQIRDGMKYLALHHGIVTEGAGSVAMAAILAGEFPFPKGQPLIALVSGRNIDLDTWKGFLES
ncbi:pyridoxal-phosphate dependent enzyme [Leptospira fluminis]|uniref:Pyridoxal-phosphate dependent enzyme n=1 Tax=Leptospira fluminis TaxID=2484979 RepID=A0A4R9GLP9_9LEPT|nr:pyridoxal-phosphate dependent enzyme [Leptospira fluminis]TGK15686.1 pyridoxal-phosphate dependent enzyme [Leptospira fluminis]